MGDVTCQSCGNTVRETAKFCPRCGGQVSAWTPPSAVEPQQPLQQQQPYQQPPQPQQPYPQQPQQPYPQQPQQPYDPYQQQQPYQQPYQQQQQSYQQSYYQQQQQPYYGQSPQPYGYGVPADAGTRFLGLLIDGIPALFASMFFWFPLFGPIIYGLLAGAYVLLRDIKGASLGKMAMGTRVFSKSGGEADTQSLIMRNLPLAAPYALLLIPFAGWLIFSPLAFVVGIVEVVMYFTQGERLGDKIANTVVLKIK
ncbi:MAG: RDD family protein [Acidobacteriota bacterium]